MARYDLWYDDCRESAISSLNYRWGDYDTIYVECSGDSDLSENLKVLKELIPDVVISRVGVRENAELGDIERFNLLELHAIMGILRDDENGDHYHWCYDAFLLGCLLDKRIKDIVESKSVGTIADSTGPSYFIKSNVPMKLFNEVSRPYAHFLTKTGGNHDTYLAAITLNKSQLEQVVNERYTCTRCGKTLDKNVMTIYEYGTYNRTSLNNWAPRYDDSSLSRCPENRAYNCIPDFYKTARVDGISVSPRACLIVLEKGEIN